MVSLAQTLSRALHAVSVGAHHLPAPIRRGFGAVTGEAPGLALRALKRLTGGRGFVREIPEPATPPADSPVTLVVGPANYAGQGYGWARAAEQNLPGVWAHNIAAYRASSFAFPADTVVDFFTQQLSPEWQRRQFAQLARCSHVLIEAERAITGGLTRNDYRREVERLRRCGVKVATIAHGSDIRVPSIHTSHTPWSPFRESGSYSPWQEYRARENLRQLRRVGGPQFVSTPDLLDFLPDGIWCPVVIDTARWASDAPVLEREVPVVAHAPSKGTIKGTHLIEPTLRKLSREGVIDYRPVSRVKPEDMPAVYQSADIVLDQFCIGSYGVAACEAMAAGRVVVSYVTDKVRRHVTDATGETLPILDAQADTLEEVLRGIVANREEARARAQQGRAFVEKLHSGQFSARVLNDHWLGIDTAERA